MKLIKENLPLWIESLLLTFLTYVALTNMPFYETLDGEFGVIELAGAISLFVASVVLFLTFLDYKKNYPKKDYRLWMLLFASIAFFWASGEEISWGQHFFGTETPEWLGAINGQNETNLHNINKKFFDRTLEQVTVLLTVISSIQLMRSKNTFIGFKLPSLVLTIAYILIPIYRKNQFEKWAVQHVGFAFLFMLTIFYAIKKEKKEFLLCALSVVFMVSIVFIQESNPVFKEINNFYHEVRETIFSILCVFYALELKKFFSNSSHV